MATHLTKLNILVIGGGMISEEVVLPTVFQERRDGRIGEVSIASRRAKTLKHLQGFFPTETFRSYPDPDTTPLDQSCPEAFQQALADLKPPAAVIVATPDHLHTGMILAAVEAGFDVVVQKPLCLRVAEAWQIQEAAEAAGVYVFTDLHKRHDRAIRALRYRYREGYLGELLHGHAWIEERREIPLDHFRLWAHLSSPFEYVGVHYVDAYHFFSGLRPKRLVAFGQKKFLPQHGSDAYDAVQATIEWEDGSVYFVQTAWVNTQSNSSLTNQGMQILGTEGEYWADHKARGMHFASERAGYEDYNPNFFKAFDSWDHVGQVDWTGYGYESIAQGLNDIRNLWDATQGLEGEARLAKRREMIAALAENRPVPTQALVSTAVNEAVRLSMDHNSAWVGFDDRLYPHVL